MNFSALKSKTVWFGIVQLLFAFGMTAATGEISEVAVATLCTGVGTIIFRALTDKPLSAK